MVELIDKAQLAVTQVGARGGGEFTHRLAGENHVARGGRIQAAEQMQQRTFARAGGADNGHHLAFTNAEADIVQDIGLHIAFLIAFAQVVALQQDLIHNVKPQRVGWRQRARKGTT